MNKGKNSTSPIVSYTGDNPAQLERTNYAFSVNIFN